MNDLIYETLKKIADFWDIIKSNRLHYKLKRGKVYNFSEYFLPIIF